MRRAALALLSVAVLIAVGTLLVAFAWPNRPITQREIDFGPVDAFAPGSVTTYRLLDGESGPIVVAPGWLGPQASSGGRVAGIVVHIVRLEDGSFLALSGKSSHLGEFVPWRADFAFFGRTGWFREPLHGDTFAIDGTRVFGPAPRSLDRFALRIEDGRVIVDPTDVTLGARTPPPARNAPTATPAATAEATQPARP